MEALLNLLQCSLGLARAEIDAEIALQNQIASTAMERDILAALNRRKSAGRVEFSIFTGPNGRP